MKEEVEEIKRLREQMVFKASKIRNFRGAEAIVSEKSLTVPVMPKLATLSRAQLKEDVDMK